MSHIVPPGLIRLTSFLMFMTVFGVGVSHIACAAAPKNPNIVVILADDLGYGDVSCYNDKSKVATQNIDKLAAQGVRFTDAHSPCTVCTPSRYSLMTGQMAFRVPRGGTLFTGAGGPSLIAKDRLKLPKMLHDVGYTTAATGKWHIGMTFFDKDGKPIHKDGLDGVQRTDFSRKIEGGPLDQGFERFFGTACCPSTDFLYAYIDNDRVPVPPTELIDRSKLPKHPYANDCRIGMIAPDFKLDEVDLEFLKRSQRFLEDHVRKSPEKPFFLYHATHGVHLPSFAARQFQGKTKAGPHGDFIFELDYVVGELMKTLDQLGVAENTIVIFSSDNGPETTSIINMRGDYDHDGARPWRGVKRDSWEGGHRVPCIVRWPRKVKAGSSSGQLFSLLDIMATVAAIVDVPLPDNAAEDSFNMLPTLLGKDTQPIRPLLIAQAFAGARDLSLRKGNWKYLNHTGSGGNNYENSPGLKKFIIPDGSNAAPGQLYDLKNDPCETKNVYSEYPEVVKELKALLQEAKSSGRTRPPTVKPQ
ncbi:arylsulfatase [soil metagenome]